MTTGQQFVDVIFNVLGLILNNVVGVLFDTILVPLLQAILDSIFGSGG